ncbi:MAG: PKD domain-containing protein, partial [Cytophagales bacterium]
INLVGNNGSIVRWESSATNAAPWQTINITTSPFNYSNLASSTYFRAIVKNGECTENTSSNTILITVANGGNISGVGEVCSSDATSRTLSLTNQIGTISRWQRSTNNGVSWNDIAATNGATSLAISSLTQTTKYRAVVTEDGGDIYSNEHEVYVNPLPAPDFSATTACLNAATVFTNSSSIAQGSILSHVWNFGDNSGASIATPSRTFANAGSYNVKLVLTSAKLCKDSITKAVVVRPLPDVNFDFVNVCDQNPVAFTNLSSLPGYTLTYAWGFGDSFTSNVSDPTHTYVSKGNYNVSLTVFANGTCARSLTKTVTIHEKPQANFSFANVCDGNAMKFANASNIANGNLTYLWNFNDGGSTSALQNPEYTFSAPAIFNVSLTASSAFGCTNSVGKAVQVFPNPVPNFNAANVCIGQSTTFNNTSSISTGFLLYNWNFKDGTISNALSPTKMYAASGSYYAELTVTSDRNCVQSIEKEVIIYQKPTVNFTYSNICTNDTVNFNNTSAFFGGTINYTWTFGDDSPTSSAISPLKPYTSAGNFVVSLLGVSNSGCADTKVQTISVYTNPVASFTNSASTCFGQSTTFTNNSSISAGTIASRVWDFGDGTTSNLLNPSRAFTQDGTYRVFLTVTSNRSCTDTTSKLITVSQKPTARFIQNDVCKGSQMSFTNQSSGISNSTSFTWNFGDFVGTSSAQSPNYTYINPGAYNVTLTVSNLNGCEEATSKLVNVFDAAVANFSKKDTCEGNVFPFTNLSTLNAGTMSYLWNFGNGTISSNTEPAVIYSSSGTYNVQLTVTTDKGCQSNRNIPLNVFPNPIVLFNAQDVCYALPTSFINNSQINSGTITYNWNFGDQSSSASTNPFKTYNGPGTYFVQLNAASDKGCKGSTSKFIEVYPKPNADFTFNELCAGQLVNFSNISSIESGTMSYTWTLGNSQTSNLTNPTTTYTNPATYEVSLLVVSNRNCLDTTSKVITVYPLPVVGFATDTVCDGLPTTFKSTSTIPTGSLVYFQWDFGDLTNSLQENPIHQFLNGGNYNVTLLAESEKGCKQIITKPVAVNNVPVSNFTVDNACLGTPAAFVNRTTIAPGTAGVLSYTWNFDDGARNTVKDPTYIYAASATYFVTLKSTISGGQCSDSTTKAITIYELPNVSIESDTTVSKGVSIALNVSASEGTYSWSPIEGVSNSLASSVIIKPEKSADYIFTATDKRGCKASDTIKITVKDDFNLVGIENTLSNIITPDGNGQNDTWVIDNITSYPDNTVLIFNRWGQEVFKAQNYQNNWAGTSKAGDQLPDGTYYFVITFENSSVVQKGAITILVDADKTNLKK